MAGIQLKTPEPFDFNNPDSWSKWKRRFEQFREASGLSGESETRQVSTLLYTMGENADNVLTSTRITSEERKKYDTVLAKLDGFFKVRRNVIFERAKFNRRNQLPGETVEQYISELYALVETCEYGNLTEEMLRDRIVVGIRDEAISKRLQLDPELTLDKAKKAVRLNEAVQDQQRQLKGEGTMQDPVVVDAVSKYSNKRAIGGKTTPHPQQLRGGMLPDRQQSAQACSRCGHSRHPEGVKCPAISATCHRCNRRGHYSSLCFSKTKKQTFSVDTSPTDELSVDTTPSEKLPPVEELSLDTAFLDAMATSSESSWYVTVTLDTKVVQFKLDTGAAVTAISEETYRALPKTELKKPSKILSGPANQKLTVLGQFTGALSNKEISSRQEIFVVQGLRHNLLGLPAITALQLICRIHTMVAEDIYSQFPTVFRGLGTLGDEYLIKLKDDAQPHSLHTPRNIPLPLRKKVQEELTRMESGGIISKVDEPTPWCAGMVVVPKKSGAIRICVDLKKLNEGVLREVHPMPKVDETLALLAGATIFSKLDANSGFWQIPLAKDSRHLTTFITPFGRYCFNKLPFGITSAPELFQKRMKRILEGLQGVVCQMDDILVFGSTPQEHNSRLLAVLQQLQSANVTLNRTKCEFNQKSVKFLGHLVDSQGIRADPEKIAAVSNMKPPTSVTELRRFLGMANQLGKFSPRLSQISQPLRELLSPSHAWVWGPTQEDSFIAIKTELTQPTVLALYDPEASSKVSADASSYGLGAVLLQQSGQVWKPVAYASRSMTETERRYAQIEKEALAVTWACDKFANYILGTHFLIESDHKPLIPLLNAKNLDHLPPRILRFRLRMARFNYTVSHVPGKLLTTADALSRAPSPLCDNQLQEEVEWFVDTVVAALPAGEHRLKQYKDAQDDDSTCMTVKRWCLEGWPAKSPTDVDLSAFWKVRSFFSLHNNLLLYNQRIVIPSSLRKETLAKIHEEHQGIERCRARVRCSVWWPEITKDTAEIVRQCPTCARESQQRREPLIKSTLPDYPWQIIGTDLFELEGTKYLLTVDYFSRYPEVTKLTTTTSAAVISHLKNVFSHHGIPEVVHSDNGPQFSALEFTQFANEYGFCHITSSPKYPQSNGQAERMVQTVKHLLKNSKDPYMAMLTYRSTPLPWCGRSPAELSMGRQIRTCVPTADCKLIPQWTYLAEFQKSDATYKLKQKDNFDKRHRTKDLPMIPDDTPVWIDSDNGPVSGRVVTSAETPRSYLVETPSGQLQRNRIQLRVVPQESNAGFHEELSEPEEPHRMMTRSQTGTEIRPPRRFS